MHTRIAVVLLLLLLGVPVLTAQTEESVDSNAAPETVTTSTSTTSVTVTTNGVATVARSRRPPPWLFLVKLAAEWGPIVFLLAAWLVGTIVHFRIVKREQALFPVTRGTRAPQTTPIIISATLFFVPALIFIFFEILARQERILGIDNVIGNWHPLAQRAWLTLLVCFVLALIPWLFARRADSVA